MGRVDNERNSGDLCRNSPYERRNWRVHVNDMELLAPKEPNQLDERQQCQDRVHAPCDRDSHNVIAICAHSGNEFSIGAHSGDRPALLFHAINQWQEKVLGREIDRAQLANLRWHRLLQVRSVKSLGSACRQFDNVRTRRQRPDC